MREKVGKSRNTVFFKWFGAPEGRKVGSLKQRVRSHLARWEMKNCTPLWREAHLQVKKLKTPHVRTTFGSWDVEKVHAVVARSTFRSQNVKNTSSGPLLGVEMSKKCAPLWREAHFEVKMYKEHQVRTTFGSWAIEKVHAVVAQNTFRDQNVWNTSFGALLKLSFRKSTHHCGTKHISKLKCEKQGVRTTFLDVQMSFGVAGARDCGPCQKWAKCEGFVAFPKNDGRRGTCEEDLQRCIFRGRRSTRDMFIKAVRRSGRWFPERGCILERQIFRFAEMIVRDKCSTSYDLASFFRGRRSSLDKWIWKIAKRIGTRPSALHTTFHFWRKSPRIASFLTLSSSNIEEVSRNCCLFDVVKFKTWGRLAQ